MLTPTDFIFNDLEEFQRPNFVESFHPAYENSDWYRSGDPYPESIIKYQKLHDNKTHTSVCEVTKFSKFLNDYIHCLDNTSETDLYFPGVRYLSSGLVVFERPPSYKIVDVSLDTKDNINDETGLNEYYLPIPWQVYIAMYNPKDMRLAAVKMFFTKTSLFDKDQTLYAPPIFNFFGNGSLCRPFFDSIEDIEKYPKTISGIMASAYDWVWNSGFNFDITENLAEMIHTEKYQQFEPYMVSEESKQYYNFLKQNPLRSIGGSLSTRYSNSLLKCWEQIPLEYVSSISWTNYSTTDFMFQEFTYGNGRDLYFDDYVAENNITLSQDGDSYEDSFHCESDCECECDDSDCGCCNGCECSDYDPEAITRDYIYRTSDFAHYVTARSRAVERNLEFAMDKSIKFLKDNRLAHIPLTSAAIHNNINHMIDSHFSA